MTGYRHLDASEIAALLPGAALSGPMCAIESLGLVDARATERVLTYAQSEQFLAAALRNDRVVGVVTTERLYLQRRAEFGQRCAVLVDDPHQAFWGLHLRLFRDSSFYQAPRAGRSPEIGDSRVAPSAVVHDGVRIGDRCRIADHVVVHAGTVIGDDVVIQAGTIVGSEGFEYKTLGGVRTLVPHDAGVRIGDRVEIGANCAIDRGLLAQDTTIGEDTKMDNLVHVSHACRIGKRCLIAALVAVGGSVCLDDGVWLGPNSAISNRVTVGRGGNVSLGAVVVSDVEPDQKVSGNFAVEHGAFLKLFMEQLRAAKR